MRGASAALVPAGGLRPASAARADQSKYAFDAQDDDCDHPAMDVWSHEGKLYEINSWYCLPEDAWHYELVGLTGAPGTGPWFAVAIPDATPDGPNFTPRPAQCALVHVGNGQLPWPILHKLIGLAESNGDLVEEQRDLSAEGTSFPSTRNVWWHDSRQFEVNSFHHGGAGSWCYKLYEVQPNVEGNDYVEVQIPDSSPDSGPFIPEPADHVILTIHGSWTIPWPIFRRFIDAIEMSGDIVRDGRAAAHQVNVRRGRKVGG